MPVTRRVFIVEEIESDGNIAQRQSVQTYTDNEDGSWTWDKPADRMAEGGSDEWDRVMALLANVNGEDLRSIVCANGLMDHCNGLEYSDDYVA